MVSRPPILVNFRGKCLDLGKRLLYKKEYHGKLLKAPKMVLSRVWQEVHFRCTISGAFKSLPKCSFLYDHLLPKVKPLLQSTKIEGPDTS